MKAKTKTEERIVYLDKQFVPESDAKISVLDHGVLHGDSVFDTCMAWNGGVFKLEAHLIRLFESANAVGIDIPLSQSKLTEIILETVRRNGLKDAYIKIVITRGVGDYPTLQPTGCKPTVIVFARPYSSSVAEGDKPTPQKLKTSTVRRIPVDCIDPKIKSCNYLNHVLAYLDALASGADNAIELNLQGYIAEAPGYNIFIVKNGILRTPGTDILVGITRETVFEIASTKGWKCIESKLTLSDLYNADEVFLASTSGGIVPVSEVDGRVIGNGDPGPITTSAWHAYMDLLVACTMSTPVY